MVASKKIKLILLTDKNTYGAFCLIAAERPVSVENRCILMFYDVAITYYARKPSSAPAATAEPITPATFGPRACMSR